MKKNPFHDVVALFNDKPRTVTMQLLDEVRTLMEPSVSLPKYANVFEVLQYLHDNKALTITTTNSGSYTITSNYVNSN